MSRVPYRYLVIVILILIPPFFPHAWGEPLTVCATVPDLGDIAEKIGGNEVDVTVFVKGSEDPHFLEARPSFIKKLSQAALYLQVGLEVEVGWAPVLLANSRNGVVQPGASGYLDASEYIRVKGSSRGSCRSGHGRCAS